MVDPPDPYSPLGIERGLGLDQALHEQDRTLQNLVDALSLIVPEHLARQIIHTTFTLGYHAGAAGAYTAATDHLQHLTGRNDEP